MKNPILFIDENIPLLSVAIGTSADVRLFKGRKLTNTDLLLNKCEGIVCRSTTKVNQKLLDGTDAKFIATATSGFDHIDINYLIQNNLFFSYAPGSNANSVAEYVIFSILEWKNKCDIDLNGKSIGIIGFGNIGKIVGHYSFLLGLKVFVNDPPLKDRSFIFPDYTNYLQLDEIFECCDIITNHVPLSNNEPYSTTKLISNIQFEKLKKEILFIHSSRGSVVDEGALINAIEQRNIKTVIDVWENEPFCNEILAKLSLLATPHIAGYSYDGKLKGALMMANSLKDYFRININKELIINSLKNNILFSKDIFKDIVLLYNLLSKKRMLPDDCKRFLKITELSQNLKAAYFDELRKKYPERRESILIEI